jgi:DNA-binding ferritin-like protein
MSDEVVELVDSIAERIQILGGVSIAMASFLAPSGNRDAEAAAEVAEFAGALGKFWEMHDKLYENQERLGEALYLDLAEKLKLSTTDCVRLWSSERSKPVSAPTSRAASEVE